jgi:cyclohexadienyl dehydratase
MAITKGTLMKIRLLSALFVAMAMAAFSTPALAQSSRLARVLASGELRVCIWPDYYSISYRNPKTRQLSGIDIDMSKDLGRELGVTVRYVDSSFALLVDNLLNDQCDIAMHAVGITPARTARLQFTQPYLRSDIYAIVPKNSSTVKNWADLDKPGRVVAVTVGTIMEPVMQQSLKLARLLVVKPPMTREHEVESGRADAFMTDYPYSRRMLDMTDWARMVSPPQVFHTTDYGYALAPGDKSLLHRVDAYISAAKKDGRLMMYARKHQLEPIALAP